MTNYIHMLGSGHIADEYRSEWKNLYQHSQQGWEAFKPLLKTFFFRRSWIEVEVEATWLKPPG